jgi:WD40 repeat protein
MRRLFLLFTLCLTLLAAPVAAQDAADEYRGFYNMEPIARFGFGRPHAATFMPDGESFAIATGAGVTFYDLAFNEIQHINTWDHVPGVIAVSPDGRTLATGGGDVRLWDIETGTLLDILPAGRGIGGLAFSTDGLRLAVSKGWGASEDGLGIYIFDVASGRQQARLATNAAFAQVAFHPDGERLVARRVYDCCGSIVLIGSEDITLPPIFNPEAEAFVVTPDGEDLLVFMQGLGWVKQGIEETDAFLDRNMFIQEVSSIAADGTFTTVTDDGEVTVWDSKTLQQTESFSLGFEPYAISIAAISPDGRHVIAVKSGSVLLIDMQTRQIETRDYTLPRIGPMVVSEDAVFYIAPDFQIGWWDIWSDEYGFLNGHLGNINALAVSDDGMLYSGSDDGTIRRWNTAEKESDGIVLFEQPDTQVKALTLSRDDQLFAVVCESGQGLLLRLDGTSGESLGFFSSTEEASPTLSAIELQHCDITLGPVTEGNTNDSDRLIYADRQSVYTLDKFNANDLSQFTPPVRFHKLYFGGNSDANVFVYRGLAFTWDSMIYNVLTHNFDITAFAQPIESSLFVSSACAEELGSRDGAYCIGVDMALSDLYGNSSRKALIGHSEIVREILVHPTLPLLVSLSEDGTIILWGSPYEPQPFRRIGGLGGID